ncbi:uncharacterized protein [Drosophila kikkawai]|uniref:Peptidase aspartic putative domain-containing protein n=1 Tax=Drosophila kikkawai TaxID=30033 RepID=A0ABM4GFV3_DROKI
MLTPTQIAARQVISRELPVFSGKAEEWLLFISNYEQSTERCGFSNEENLIRLQKCLRGSALDAVRGKLIVPAMVPYAIGTLKMLYGRSEIVHASLQRKLKEEPAIKPNNLESVIRLALAVQNYCATMLSMSLHDYLNDSALLSDLVAKLSSDLKLDWGRNRLAAGGENLPAFDNWLFGVAMCATMVTPYDYQPTEKEKGGRHVKERLLVHNTVEGDDKKNQNLQDVQESSCPGCDGDHELVKCKVFLAMSIKSRLDIIKAKRLCFCCFGKHIARNCKVKKTCNVNGCKLHHNKLLHFERVVNEDEIEPEKKTSDITSESTVFFHDKSTEKALFRYIPVTLHNGSRAVDVLALIDEGSSCTLMERKLADELGLDGPEEELCLKWTGDMTQTEAKSKLVCINVSAAGFLDVKYVLKEVRTVSKLDLPLQSIDD